MRQPRFCVSPPGVSRHTKNPQHQQVHLNPPSVKEAQDLLKHRLKYLYSWLYSVFNCTTSSNSLSCLISSKSGLRYTAVAKRTSVFLGPLFVWFKVDDISTIKSARILVGVTSTSCIKNTYRI